MSLIKVQVKEEVESLKYCRLLTVKTKDLSKLYRLKTYVTPNSTNLVFI